MGVLAPGSAQAGAVQRGSVLRPGVRTPIGIIGNCLNSYNAFSENPPWAIIFFLTLNSKQTMRSDNLYNSA